MIAMNYIQYSLSKTNHENSSHLAIKWNNYPLWVWNGLWNGLILTMLPILLLTSINMVYERYIGGILVVIMGWLYVMWAPNSNLLLSIHCLMGTHHGCLFTQGGSKLLEKMIIIGNLFDFVDILLINVVW